MEQQDPANTNPGQDQPYQPYNSGFNPYGAHLPVPNSSAVLVLGILSIVFCWCYGVVSIVLGVIALVLASAAEKEYKLNPPVYTISSYKNLKAGKTCAVIGLCLAGLGILCFIIYVVLVGTLAFNFLNLGLNH